jgi:hypothetical protein
MPQELFTFSSTLITPQQQHSPKKLANIPKRNLSSEKLQVFLPIFFSRELFLLWKEKIHFFAVDKR